MNTEKFDWKYCSHMVRNNFGINGRIDKDYDYILWENGLSEVLPNNGVLDEYRTNFVIYIQPYLLHDLPMYLFKTALRLEKEIEDLQEKQAKIDYEYYLNPSKELIKEQYEQCCKLADFYYEIVEKYQIKSEEWLGCHYITGLFERIRMTVIEELPLELPDYTEKEV